MDIIAYTSPGYVENEYDLIKGMFQEGLQSLHVYKPGFDVLAIYTWLDTLGSEYWNKLTLHLFEGWITCTVAGYHLSKKFLIDYSLSEIASHLIPGQSVSVSAHNTADWINWKDHVHSVVISPVYQSISKPGHFPAQSLNEWNNVFMSYPGKAKKIALGGITSTKIVELQNIGFNSIAIAGWLWENEENVVDRYKLIKHSVDLLDHE